MAKKTNKESSSNIEQDIAIAAEHITRLISAELSEKENTKEATKETPQKKNARFIQSKENQEKKKLALFSIICLCVIVFAMWGWNTSALWYKTNNSTTDKTSLWSQAKDDLTKTFATENAAAKKDSSLQGALNNEVDKQAALKNATAAALVDLQKVAPKRTTSTTTTPNIITTTTLPTTTKKL